MKEFQETVGTWGARVFPGSTNRSIIKHLKEEVEEIDVADTIEENLPEECADAFLMLLHLAHRNGFDLLEEAQKKFEKVRNARWEDTEGRGYLKRVKE